MSLHRKAVTLSRRLAPGLAPRGLFMLAMDATGRPVLEQAVSTHVSSEAADIFTIEAMARGALCLAAYDGDTGDLAVIYGPGGELYIADFVARWRRGEGR